MNLKKKLSKTTVFVTIMSLISSSTVLAAPSNTNATEPITEEEQNVSPETEIGHQFYLKEDLPDIVAVNRLLDDEKYGNESYFLAVSDLGAEVTFYDQTGNLSTGENTHQKAEEIPGEALVLHGGQQIRVTIYYHDDSEISALPQVGSRFPSSLEAGMVETIWGQVYLFDPKGETAAGKGAFDRAYNVVPVIADEDVNITYVENSLMCYGVDETLQDAVMIPSSMTKNFFQEDAGETGITVYNPGTISANSTESSDIAHAGYVTYKLYVSAQPNAWDKAESATKNLSEKASDIWNSDAMQKFQQGMNDAGAKVGDATSKWVNKWLDNIGD